MAIKLIGADIKAIFDGRKFIALSPPRGDIRISTVLTRKDTSNPKRTSIEEIARNNIDRRGLKVERSVLKDVAVAWSEKDDAALDTMLGANAANIVRAKIKAAAEQSETVSAHLTLTELVYETTDIVAVIKQIQQLEVIKDSFVAKARFFFVDAVLHAAGVKVEIISQQAGAAGVEASGEKLGHGAQGSVHVAQGQERKTVVEYEKFPEPLTLYCSALEFRKPMFGSKFEVVKKKAHLSLGGGSARIFPALEWLEGADGSEALGIDD